MAGAEQRGFLALLRALVDSGVDLAHNTARMAASEGRVVMQRVIVRLGIFVAALFVAAMGFLRALLGAALVLARIAGVDEWVALVAVGLVALAAGAALALRAVRLLGAPDLAFPATLAEFNTDIEMLRSGRAARDGEGGAP